MKKTQYFQVEFKSVEVKGEWGKIYVEGFASTPDLDSYDDIVKPEAFRNTMGSYMQKPLILLQHNMDKIIGKAVEYRIETDGLFIRVEIFNDIDWVMNNIQEGLLGAFSIWFRALKWEIREVGDKWIREIIELRLVEVSVVAFPANTNARFSIAKSIKSFFDSLTEIKSFGAWLYECKSNGEEIVNFEEEMKNEEIQEIEVKEEENTTETTEEKSEESVEENENTETKNTTETDDVEIDSENLPDDDTGDVKAEELKALQDEVERLKKENETFSEELKAKDTEIEELKTSKTEIEATLEKKEAEIKEYLSVGEIEVKETVKTTPWYTFNYFLN